VTGPVARAGTIAPAATIPMMGKDAADIIAGPAMWCVLEGNQSEVVLSVIL